MIFKYVKLSATWVSWALEITVIRQIGIFAVPDIQYNPTQLNIILFFKSTVSVSLTGHNFNSRRFSPQNMPPFLINSLIKLFRIPICELVQIRQGPSSQLLMLMHYSWIGGRQCYLVQICAFHWPSMLNPILSKSNKYWLCKHIYRPPPKSMRFG